MENNILLSICIPTFNRAESLSYSLRSVIEATKGFESSVEIIVSNNCSTDLTNEVLKSYSSISNYKYFTNQSNIGFNYNYFKLIDLYSSGKYCWIIGDDDFLKPDSVSQVLAILSLYLETDFIYANYETKPFRLIIKDFNDNSQIFPITDLYEGKGNSLCSFNELLNKNIGKTNILLTYISASIFNRKLLKEFDKSIFSDKSWVTFRDVFPHSYMFGSTMINRTAYYFDNPLIIAAVQEKDWDQFLPFLYLKYLPELSHYYKSIGYSKKELFKTDEIIVYSGLIHFFINLKFSWDSINARLIFVKYYLFNPALFSELFKLFIKLSKKFCRKNLE